MAALAVVVEMSAPTLASGRLLLYVNTAAASRVIDVEAENLRKIIPLPRSEFETTSFFSLDFSELPTSNVLLGGHVYAVARSPMGPPEVVVIDPERNEIVDTVVVLPPEAPPFLPSVLQLGASASALYGLAGGFVFTGGPLNVPSVRLLKIDALDRTVTTLTALPNAVLGPLGVTLDCCSEQAPCPCDQFPDFAVSPNGDCVFLLRARAATDRTSQSTISHLDVLAIDGANGSIQSEIRVADVPPFGTAEVRPLGDGARAVIKTNAPVPLGLAGGEGPLRTLLATVDFRSGAVELTGASGFQDIAVAPNGLEVYGVVGLDPTLPPGPPELEAEARKVFVLDGRPSGHLQLIKTLPFPRANDETAFSTVTASGSLGISQDGSRLGVAVLERPRGSLPPFPIRAVTFDVAQGGVISDVPLGAFPRSFPDFDEPPAFQLVFADGCSDDPTTCYCERDSDCHDINPCNRGACEGSQGCQYEWRSCFAGALCLLGAPATIDTGAPSSEACTRFRERVEKLSERVREAVAAGEALPPGTASVRYRSVLRRAESVARARLAPELRLLARTSGSRGLDRRFACISHFGIDDGTDLGIQLEVLRRLRSIDINVCRKSGG